MSELKLEQLMLDIIELDEFEDKRYYAIHLRKALWNIFRFKWEGIPYFLRSICDKVSLLLSKYQINESDIIKLLTQNSNYLWVCLYIKRVKSSSVLNENEIMLLLLEGKDISEYVDFDNDKLVCSLACFILDESRIKYLNFNEVTLKENFEYEITDYNLTKVDRIEFLPWGYVFKDKYYLYNLFISLEKLEVFDKKPAVFKLIEEITNPDIYLRIDERLAVPKTEMISLETTDFERFRGIEFRFKDTILEKIKNIIVHIDPKTANKLLMVVKKDYDRELNEGFWHVELEELPYIEDSKRNRTTVTFIHAKYYYERGFFRHIDYIKNQYPFEKYCEKYKDSSNQEIKIDYYTDKINHYKIWCVEETDISEDIWYKLVCVSLRPLYRKLFNEILGKLESD